MIAHPITVQQREIVRDFMNKHAYVSDTPDVQYIAWVEDNTVRMCVALNAFLGKTCQIHVAMEPGYVFTPKAMLSYVFDYAYNTLGIETLIGIVNSHNKRALKYDRHLGFEETTRLIGMHDDGGDIVFLTMPRDNCKYLKKAA